MPMSKQEATDFVLGELARRRDRNDIVQELCRKTGGSPEQVQRFVQLVESQNHPATRPAQSPASAPAPVAAPPARPAPLSPSKTVKPPTAAPVVVAPPSPRAPASPPPPASPLASIKAEALDTPENITFVIKEIAGHRHRNDIIIALCEKTGSSWDQVQRFVQRVESENRQAITARQSPLLIMIGVGTIIAGLLVVAYYGFRTLTGTIYIFLNMPIPYLGNAVYIGTGLAMTAGGIVGLLRTARNLVK
jgi:hypothetical protein